MMIAVWATDRPGMLAERQRVREAHRARLREPGAHAVTVLLAGPWLADEAGDMVGTLLVVEAPDVAAVRAFIAEDPYVLAGVYDQVEIRPWRCGIGPLAPPSA